MKNLELSDDAGGDEKFLEQQEAHVALEHNYLPTAKRNNNSTLEKPGGRRLSQVLCVDTAPTG